jgi:hypothetical protein
MCIYTVTKGTNGDNVPKCLPEEMGTNHLRSMYLRFVSCHFVSLSFCEGN